VVGTVRVAPGAPPFPLDDPTGDATGGAWSWRLRWMAVLPELRNRGLGALLVAAASDHAEGQGATLLWCNARVPAVGLYRRAGFTVEGRPWEEPDIGPHVVMWRSFGR
jgi:GNAT superfamily N-acetyltransferase